jgi:crossover junction endodeoxyribonuclease RuvC
MTILGIDPGFERVGFGVVSFDSDTPQLIDYGCIRTDKKQPFAARLAEIAEDLKLIILQHKPHFAVLEEIYFSKNVKTGIKVAQSRGVILRTLEICGIQIQEINPGTVKLAVTGYGRADKDQIRKMVQTLLGLSTAIKSDDAADALACALSYSHIKIPTT